MFRGCSGSGRFLFRGLFAGFAIGFTIPRHDLLRSISSGLKRAQEPTKNYSGGYPPRASGTASPHFTRPPSREKSRRDTRHHFSPRPVPLPAISAPPSHPPPPHI